MKRIPLHRVVPGLWLLFVTAIASSLAAQSQATTGVIRGVVTDPNGAPVANATVILRETNTGFQRTLQTNDRGIYVASLLPLGTYDVTARSLGYSESRRMGVTLRVGETVEVPISLAAVEVQAVTVTAVAPVIDVTRVENATRLPDQAVQGLPNNGRNFLSLTLLTPNVAVVQGPDGDELTVAGQRGIHNNVSVDGADFNNPFFGEQRGGQRPAFTFNLDAVQEIVVIASGANAEFGRSGGGFVNVITKSGTNDLRGSLHYYGKDQALSGQPRSSTGATFAPTDFRQHQFGFTIGGPIVRDRAFFFAAYDQQAYDETKQTSPTRITDPVLRQWMDTAFGGALRGDYGPISRTNDARAFLAKIDWRPSERHSVSLKYNHSWSEQVNGTFDVDTWGRSANAMELDKSNAVNGALVSYLSSNLSNEFRFQYSREDRPRPYDGPRLSSGRPFPDTGMDFVSGYRFGMPFFIPVEYYDTRVQLVNNVSYASGNHLFKLGAEWNRVESVQTFIGFANGRFIFNSVQGFLDYVRLGRNYVQCSGGGSSTTGACPTGQTITGPVELYLQQAGIDRTVEDAGTQSIPQTELAFFLQDTWKPSNRLTINYGLRWEAQLQPDPITAPADVFYAPFIGRTVTNSTGTYAFPSDGTIPSDKRMIQPRLGITWDPDANGMQVFRASAGVYYARIPGLNLASSRSTNGSIGQTYFRNSALTGVLGPPPAYDSLLPPTIAASAVFQPSVFVFDKDFRNPRTFNLTLGWERQVASDLAFSITYTHSRTDFLTRFIDRNAAVFGAPWATGRTGAADPNGLGTLTTVESSALSRYHGLTFGLRRSLDPNFQFQINYTVSFDKSDDDNERDPFSFRYARANALVPEYNWSDRDQRHRVNAWLLAKLGGLYVNNRISLASAQPVSESCGANNRGTGNRAVAPTDRICPNGSILARNTLRKDNAFFSWDVRFTVPFSFGRNQVEAIVEIFNLTGSTNFRDPAYGGLLFNFDGTIRSGLGDPQQVQIGARWVF
jgi:hypothetical protein